MEEQLRQYADQLIKQNPSITQEELEQKLREFKPLGMIPGASTGFNPLDRGSITQFGVDLIKPGGGFGTAATGLLGDMAVEDPKEFKTFLQSFAKPALAGITNTFLEIGKGLPAVKNAFLTHASIEAMELIGDKDLSAKEKLVVRDYVNNIQSAINSVSNVGGMGLYIPTVDDIAAKQKKLQKHIPIYDKTITESIGAATLSGEGWGEIGGRIASQTISSLPYTLASFWAPTLILTGASVAGNKWEEEFAKNPDESAGKLLSNAAITGAVEILDGLATRYIFKNSGLLKATRGEKAAKEMYRGFWNRMGRVAGAEGLTEMGQATLNRFNDSAFFGKGGFFDEERWINDERGFSWKAFYQTLDEGIIGAFSGGGITMASQAIQGNAGRKNRAIALLTPKSVQREQRNAMNEVLELHTQLKQETDPAARNLIQKEINKGIAKINMINRKARVAVENLSEDQIIQYAKNIDLINKIDRMKDPSAIFKKQKQDAIEENEFVYKQVLEEKLSNDLNFAKEVQEQTGLETTVVNSEKALQKAIANETGRVIEADGVAGVFIGQGRIYINKDVALKQGNVTVGSHEILHPILNAMVGNIKSQESVVKGFKNIIGTSKNSLVENLLKRRGITLEKNPQKYYGEYITAFSDLMNNNQISFEQQSYWERLVNFLDSIFRPKGFENISFQDGRGVYNFLKEYSKSVKEGKLSDKIMSKIDVERVKNIGNVSSEFQNSKEANEVNELYEQSGREAAFTISEKYRGMAQKIASKYRDVPGYITMQDILVDEILTGPRGVIDLVNSYNPQSGVPLAAYINKFLPSRSIEAANSILDTKFKSDVTEVRGITEKAEQEAAVEEQRTSLRNSLGLTDAVVTKVKNSVIKTFGTKLPNVTTPQFFKSLQQSYRTELKPTIAKMMGRQEGYREFLENNFQLIYDVIPQGTFNKRFKDFVQPVVDETGKQLREKTAEGKGIFKKKKISKQQFVDYFLGDNVGASTKGTRKTALAEALAQEIAFDATMDVIKTPEVVEKINFVNGFTENFAMEVAKQIDRGVDFQFMKESMAMEQAIVQSRSILDGNKLENFEDYKAVVDKILEFGNIKIKGFGGTIFEYYVQQKGNSLNIPGVTFEGEALMGNTGVDMIMTITDKNGTKTAIPIELKADGTAQMGSGSFKITEDGKVSTTKDGKALNEYVSDVKAMMPIYREMHALAEEIQNEKIPFGFPQTGYLTETYNTVMKAFDTRLRNIDLKNSTVEKIISHYNKKGVYYMYLGDKGLVYLGSNPNKLNVKPLAADTKVYISPSNSNGSTDTNANVTIRGRLSINPKTQEQSVTLESGKFADIYEYSKETGDLSSEFNAILEQKTGILSDKIYTPVTARNEKSKKRFNYFIPHSAEDFVGMLYTTLPKGKEGDKALAWYKSNLLNPYSIAMENINRDRMQLMNDFKALKKKLKNVPKQLTKKVGNTNYTNETALRVWMWNQQGMEIPGLDNATKQTLLDQVNNNKDFVDFGNQLIQINKAEGYVKPDNNWDVGTIQTDLLSNLNDAKRKKHLEQWKNNVDQIFSAENKLKLEAAFGKGYVKNLNNILKRMESGRNRTGGGDTQIDNWLDWLNNSVGAIMFINVRSAVLQTISSVNYMNWHDNNPLKAAKAFANQKQYWKDFSMIMNSDFLVERRGGTKLNVQENEIAEMANKGGVKGAISYLLNKGFVLTRAADSFAIASGGASMYRNRVNSYIKQGMDQKQAEQQAFRDFRELTEEAQQSSRPDRISAEQAGGFGRFMLAFANTPMQYTRLMKRAAQDIVNGRGDQKTNWSKFVYYGAIQNFIFNAMQKALFALGFEDEKDENQSAKVEKVAEGMLDSILRGTGLYGNAVVAGKNFTLDLAKRVKAGKALEPSVWKLFDVAPPLDSKITKMRSALNTLDWSGDEIKEAGLTLENPAAMASAQIISATTNVPLDRVLRIYDNTRAAVASDTEAWQRVALILGWSSWELGMKKEEDEKLTTKGIKQSKLNKKIKKKKL